MKYIGYWKSGNNNLMNIEIKNKGIALITAMMIVAIVGLVTTNLLWESTLNTRKTSSTLNRDQAIQIAIGVEKWVTNLLKQDSFSSENDHLNEFWARELPSLTIDGGFISGRIHDLQGRFNLNNLVNEDGSINQDQVDYFQRFLTTLNINPTIANSVIDWIDDDQYTTYPNGAEDDFYTRMNPPYRTANREFITISELLSIRSIDQVIFNQIKPYISAIPEITKINVNTASHVILKSLDDGITINDIERLENERLPSGFIDVATSFEPLIDNEYIYNISGNSDYFQLELLVNIDNISIIMYSTIQRGSGGNSSILSRSFGTI